MRRALVRAVFAVAGIALVALACDSFEAASPDAPDASSDAPADASADAVRSDAATSDGGDATAGRFCETFAPDGGETLYCRDFDDGKPVLEGWNQTSIGPGVAIETDTTTFVSPPGSFMGRLEPDAGGGCGYARAIRDVATLRVLTRVAFDVRIGGNGTNPTEGASYFVFDTGSCVMIFSAIPTRGDLHIQGTGFSDIFVGMIDHFPRVDEWAHIEITIRAPMNKVEVSVNGQPALDNGEAILPAACITPSSRSIIVPGLFCEPLSSFAREVRIDNLVVTGTKL